LHFLDERHAACHRTDFLNLSWGFALPKHDDTRKQETRMAIRNPRTAHPARSRPLPPQGNPPLAKTLSFAVLHFTIAFTVAYLLTGSVLTGGLIALIEPACNTVAFYFHERVWQRFGVRATPHKGHGHGNLSRDLRRASR